MTTRDELRKYQDFKFDDDLNNSSISIGDNQSYFVYKQHKEYLPYIGDLYGSKYPKILLVLESHYLDPIDRDNVQNLLMSKFNSNEVERLEYFANSWYFNQNNSWNEFESMILSKHFFDTRSVILDVMEGKNNNVVILDTLKAFDEAINPNNKGSIMQIRQSIRNFAFMNFFQRPEIITGKEIKPTEVDKIIACRNFDNVFNILNPEKVVFVSRGAYKVYEKSNKEVLLNENIISVAQPGSPNFNMENKNNRKHLISNFKKWTSKLTK